MLTSKITGLLCDIRLGVGPRPNNEARMRAYNEHVAQEAQRKTAVTSGCFYLFIVVNILYEFLSYRL